MTRLDEIAAKMQSYPADAPIRHDYEYMLEMIADGEFLLLYGVIPINGDAKKKVEEWIAKAGERRSERRVGDADVQR